MKKKWLTPFYINSYLNEKYFSGYFNPLHLLSKVVDMTDSGIRIAVDFDGTIVEHAYPNIGKEMLFAFATLKALQERGHRLILWTFRIGKELDHAVQYCKDNGIEFYAINKNYPEEIISEDIPRKLDVEIFIDDRNVGGFPGWGAVWQKLHPEDRDFFHKVDFPEAHNNYPKKSFFAKIFGKG